jgi:hypothetical protein
LHGLVAGRCFPSRHLDFNAPARTVSYIWLFLSLYVVAYDANLCFSLPFNVLLGHVVLDGIICNSVVLIWPWVGGHEPDACDARLTCACSDGTFLRAVVPSNASTSRSFL